MNIEEIALGASILGLIITLHLGVTSLLNRRSREEDDVEDDEDIYNPYDLSSLPISQGEEDSKFLGQRLSPLAQLITPTNQVEINELKQKLSYAGFRRPEAMELFNAIRAGLLLIAISFDFLVIFFQGFSQDHLFFYVLTVAVVYYLPMLWLKSKINHRQESIAQSLPPMLDLLVTCMEAGLNLEGALDRVSKEMQASDAELAEEIRLILHELDAGLSVSIAFKKFASRVASDDVKNMSNVIIQSVTLGSSLGRALREYAAASRRRREFKLEEEAGKIAARLTLPLTICLLPASMIAMLAPAIVTIARAISH